MSVFVPFGIFVNTFSSVESFLGGSNYEIFRFWEGVLFIILGILLAKKLSFTQGRLQSLSNWAQNYIVKFEHPYVVAYLIGVFFAFIAAPCAIIPFITNLFIISSNPGIVNTILITGLFSLGAGIPFLLLSILVPSWKESLLNSSDRLITLLPIIAGIIIMLNGVYLIYDTYDIYFTL